MQGTLAYWKLASPFWVLTVPIVLPLIKWLGYESALVRRYQDRPPQRSA